MTEEEYIAQRLEHQINWYSKKSSACQAWYKALRVIEIVAAALIPFLSGMGHNIRFVQWMVGALGVTIAIAAASGSLFKYHENWIQYRMTSEQLKHEKFLFFTQSGPYEEETRFRVLVQRVETLISKEATTWSQISKQPVKSPAEA
jgi:hypothetical protein